MANKKLCKTLKIVAGAAGIAFAGMYLMARKKKSDYTYNDEPAEQNPFAGKKVVFVQDDNDDENADGVRGHLEAVSVSVQRQSLYSKYGKRMLDVVLSFGGLVAFTPRDVPTHQMENPEQYITKVGKFIRAHSLEGNDIIRQTTKALKTKGFARLVQYISIMVAT